MATIADPAPAKKSRNSRKALKEKNESVQTPKSPISVKRQPVTSFEKDLMEMQAMLEKLKIEKEKTEELLKEKDEILKRKEEELETKGVEQEKLKMELKKLQKTKEFKPNMTLSFSQSLPQTEREKKGKKKNDCPEMKRPSTPYILWCKDQWNEVKKQNPNADFKETSNILGAKWKTVSAEEKRPYEERYQSEKEAYLQVIAKEKREREAMKLLEDEQKQKTAMELLDQYLQFVQEAEQENKKKNKKQKDPLKPKHPLSAFLMFANERRTALRAQNKNVVEVAKMSGEEWKNMSEKQKAPYEQMAKKNKEIYLQEMEAYKRMKEEEAISQKKEEEELTKLHKQEALQLLKKKEKTENIIKKKKETKKNKKKKENTDPSKPKKPASSFLLFSKEARKALLEERPGINNSTLNALISIRWKELGEEERQIYNGKASELMEMHKKELEEYNKKCAETAEKKTTE